MKADQILVLMDNRPSWRICGVSSKLILRYLGYENFLGKKE